MNARQPVLPALLCRLNRDLLPFRLFLRSAFGIDLHDYAIGNNWRNLGGADLRRLLDDQLHVFPFWNRLSQDDPAAEWWRFCFVQFP